MLGVVSGMLVGWLHWRFYVRFMQWSLLVAPRVGLLGLVLTTAGRWLLTGMLFVAALRASGATPLSLVIGFAGATFVAHSRLGRPGP